MNVFAKIGRKITKLSSSRKRRDKEPKKSAFAHYDRRPNYHGGPIPSRRDLVSDFNRSTFVTPKNSPGQVPGTDYDGEAISRSDRSIGLSVETLDRPFVEFGGHGTETDLRSLEDSGFKRNVGPRRNFQKEKDNSNGVLPNASLESMYLHTARFHEEEFDSERVATNSTKKKFSRETAIPIDRTLRWLSDNGTDRPWDTQCEDIDRDFETNSVTDQTGTAGLPDAEDEAKHLKLKLRDFKEERSSGILQTDSCNTRSAITPAIKSGLFKLRCILFQNDENLNSTLSLQDMSEKKQSGEIGLDSGSKEGPDKSKMSRRSSSLSELTRYHRYLNFLSSKKGDDLPKDKTLGIFHSTMKPPANPLNFKRFKISSHDSTSVRENIFPEAKSKLIATILSPRPFVRPNKYPTALQSEQTDTSNTRKHTSSVLAAEDENKVASRTTYEAGFSSHFTNKSVTNSGQNQPSAKDLREVEEHSISIKSNDVVHTIGRKSDPVKFLSSGRDDPVKNMFQTFADVRRKPENGRKLNPFHFHQSGSYQAQQHSHKDRLLLQLIGEEQMENKYLLPSFETRDEGESNSDGMKISPSKLAADLEDKVDCVLKVIPSNGHCTTQEIRRQSRKGWGGRRHPDLM